jgi:hypothetical protein
MTELFPSSLVYGRRTCGCQRIVFGEAAELLVCERLGAVRLHTGQRNIAPDVRLPDGRVGEVKSSYRGKVVIFKFRMEKELHHFGPDYPYFIVVHGLKGFDRGRFFSEARIVEKRLGELVTLARELTVPRRSSGGWTRGGYAQGYYELTV